MTRRMSSDLAPYFDVRDIRKLFYLWEFIVEQGLQEDAREYLDENMDEPMIFEM